MIDKTINLKFVNHFLNFFVKIFAYLKKNCYIVFKRKNNGRDDIF